MTLYERPPALVAAELGAYAALYGSSVREMDRAVAASPGPDDLIDLTHGDTRAFLPPASARSDFEAAVEDNTEAYSAYRGSATVRRVLAPRVGELLGRDVDPASELILTPGTQGGLFTSLSALVAPGDVVAFPSKEYFMDERICAYLGARTHRVALRQSEHGIMTIDQADLDDAARNGARGIVLSHPNNPTGGIYARETAERLATWIVAHDMWAVVDQLYCRLIFDDNEFVHLGSLPGMAERTVTLLGPSKTESMSGYRLGAAIGPRDVIDAMEQVISLASLRTAGYSQHALRHWMDGDGPWLKERTAAHQEIRDFLVASLLSVPGMKVSSPAGSSYVFPNASQSPWALRHGTNDDFALAIALKKNGVVISPGYQFGMEGRGHFRVNFSQDFERLSLASSRMQEVLADA
ncbi:MAG TPA: aminotransferase class I/II-fold pyridoxal phosphate-dependent enzyme [Acidimicrobiales bacterium]|jgi:aspartate/methionine/tyrosine aminotransferase|nr:aminotransferase class I/II-fold pyridoxal phosphate-dependent enzyme [Acidimicrobiales bacterium]